MSLTLKGVLFSALIFTLRDKPSVALVFGDSWYLNTLFFSGSKSQMSLVNSVSAGCERAAIECQRQFRWERWGCPTNDMPLLGTANYRPTREAAFVHAIAAAGVMHTLSRNCSLGHFPGCGCKQRVTDSGSTWKLKGCPEEVLWGEEMSQKFIDGIETGRDARARVNIHNNEVGRLAVRNSMRERCKCHGVSGSCTLKACWQQVPDFRNVGDYLMKRYRRAVLHPFRNTPGEKWKWDQNPPVQQGEMAYLEQSPDFCAVNITAGIKGTIGRECVRSKLAGPDTDKSKKRSCRTLCTECGLRVRREDLLVEEECQCKFHWCCEVKCKTCQVERVEFTCIAK